MTRIFIQAFYAYFISTGITLVLISMLSIAPEPLSGSPDYVTFTKYSKSIQESSAQKKLIKEYGLVDSLSESHSGNFVPDSSVWLEYAEKREVWNRGKPDEKIKDSLLSDTVFIVPALIEESKKTIDEISEIAWWTGQRKTETHTFQYFHNLPSYPDTIIMIPSGYSKKFCGKLWLVKE